MKKIDRLCALTDGIYAIAITQAQVCLLYTSAAAYETPFGMMEMSVLPTQVLSELSCEKGNIDLEYVIRVGDQQAVNKLNINYKSIPKA